MRNENGEDKWEDVLAPALLGDVGKHRTEGLGRSGGLAGLRGTEMLELKESTGTTVLARGWSNVEVYQCCVMNVGRRRELTDPLVPLHAWHDCTMKPTVVWSFTCPVTYSHIRPHPGRRRR